MANDKNNIKPENSTKDSNVLSGHFDITQYTQEDIQSHIYTVRGQHVMLDSDIARLYSMETRRINEQVKRNPIKFPERYFFQLTAEEVKILKSQNATSKSGANLKSQNATSEKLKSITIGPCADFNLTEKSLRTYLDSIGFEHVQIKQSVINYRN